MPLPQQHGERGDAVTASDVEQVRDGAQTVGLQRSDCRLDAFGVATGKIHDVFGSELSAQSRDHGTPQTLVCAGHYRYFSHGHLRKSGLKLMASDLDLGTTVFFLRPMCDRAGTRTSPAELPWLAAWY
jgi:hypothetical protein